MANSTCDWLGKSGNTYTYRVHPLPVSFNNNPYGNYIYAKINSNNQWVPIYIGEGDLGDRVSDNHHQASCIKSKGATHVHVHPTGNKTDGKSEEEDLLANYQQAYKPVGCNEKEGG